mgnify:CR=1 FL=1
MTRTAGQLTALLGNEVQMTFSTMPPAMPLVQAGRWYRSWSWRPKRRPGIADTLQQVLEKRPTFGYEGRFGTKTGPWTTDMFIEAVYTGLKNGPVKMARQ